MARVEATINLERDLTSSEKRIGRDFLHGALRSSLNASPGYQGLLKVGYHFIGGPHGEYFYADGVSLHARFQSQKGMVEIHDVSEVWASDRGNVHEYLLVTRGDEAATMSSDGQEIRLGFQSPRDKISRRDKLIVGANILEFFDSLKSA